MSHDDEPDGFRGVHRALDNGWQWQWLRAAATSASVATPLSHPAFAAGASHVNDSTLNLGWALPFIGILLSIALLPQLTPKLWHRHFGKVSAFWAAAFLVPFAATFGARVALHEALHTLLLEYVPFILLLFALFVVAGGIRVVGYLIGTPGTNTAILGLGTMLASLLGTTLIQANRDRQRNVHVFVFFIFLVANIGGSLTPLGDPPLFLGFLHGVDFSWTLRAMLAPTLLCSSILLVLFYTIDRRAWRRENGSALGRMPRQVHLEGSHNLFLLAGIIGAVLLSGRWQPGVWATLFHVSVPLQSVLRDAILVSLAWLSWKTTSLQVRIENAFTWDPIQQVAMLFAGIFITIIPVLAILKAGPNGALADVVALVGSPSEAAYFWLTGLLSSFLDNAPTYLVFFNVAGGDAEALMGPFATTLLAISAGAVFFGGVTYIGNAPNFMVKAICETRGIRMPTFFGYLLWSAGILLPLFGLVTAIFFHF
jgi:Na+/H+ antiporter NhaD/arsenite permease-like protein